MKCRYFREWALYVPTKPSVRQYWWPSVNSVNDGALSHIYHS